VLYCRDIFAVTKQAFTRATLCWRCTCYDHVWTWQSVCHKLVFYRNGWTDPASSGTKASRSCCQQITSTVELVDHTCDGRRAWLDRHLPLIATRPSIVTPNVAQESDARSFCVYFCRSLQDFICHTASRGSVCVSWYLFSLQETGVSGISFAVTMVNVIRANLAIYWEVPSLGITYNNPAHRQRPRWGGHGRGLN